MGGAIGNAAGDKFYPIITKFDKDLNKIWSFSYIGCTSGTTGMGLSDDLISWAVDILYAENINDKLYGLLVPRNADGTLAAYHSYRLLMTRGNFDDFPSNAAGSTNDWNAGCSPDCSKRRV